MRWFAIAATAVLLLAVLPVGVSAESDGDTLPPPGDELPSLGGGVCSLGDGPEYCGGPIIDDIPPIPEPVPIPIVPVPVPMFPPGYVPLDGGNAYFKTTGTYVFDDNNPGELVVKDPGGDILSMSSSFSIESDPISTTENSTLISANTTTYQTESNVTSNGTTQGRLTVTFSFEGVGQPKISIHFNESSNSTLEWFRVIWTLNTTDHFLKISENDTLDISALPSLTLIDDTEIEAAVGDNESVPNWLRSLLLNWSDAGQAELYAGPVNAGGGGQSTGLVVKFPEEEADIDPTIVTELPNLGTRWNTQRKTMFAGGYYWVFFNDAHEVAYTRSVDGVHWSDPLRTGLYTGSKYEFLGGLDVSHVGSRIAVAVTQLPMGSSTPPHVRVMSGDVGEGGSIQWGPQLMVNLDAEWSIGRYCLRAPMTLAIGSYGTLWIGVALKTGDGPRIGIFKSMGGDFNLDKEITLDSSKRHAMQLLPHGQGELSLYYARKDSSLIRRWFYDGSWEQLTSAPVNFDWAYSQPYEVISGTTDVLGNVHLAYRHNGGLLAYASWQKDSEAFDYHLFPATANVKYPSVSTDLASGLHIFYTEHESSQVMYTRNTDPRVYEWEVYTPAFDDSPWYPRHISASARSISMTHIIWDSVCESGPCIRFGSLPLPATIGATSLVPWQRDGLMPFTDYFSSFGQFISPSTGQLILKQTDLHVEGRGVDLEITRVYKQPRYFLNGQPYLHEKPPFWDFGAAWDLNLPWMGRYTLHYLDGQEYLYAFDSENVFENHFGTPFRMERIELDDSYVLIDTHGMKYVFQKLPISGDDYPLVRIEDAGAKDGHENALHFNYELRTFQQETVLRLVEITDNIEGREVRFVFDAEGHIQLMRYWKNNVYDFHVIYGYLADHDALSVAQIRNLNDPDIHIDTHYSYTDHDMHGVFSLDKRYILSQVKLPTDATIDYEYEGHQAGTEAVSFFTRVQTHSEDGTEMKRIVMKYYPLRGNSVYTEVDTYGKSKHLSRTKYLYGDPKNRMTQVITLDPNGNELSRTRSWYDLSGAIGKREMYMGGQAEPSSSVLTMTDEWQNPVYIRNEIGKEIFQSYGNTESRNSFRKPGRLSKGLDGYLLYEDFSERESTLDKWDIEYLVEGQVDLDDTVFAEVPPSLRITADPGGVGELARATRELPIKPTNSRYEIAFHIRASDNPEMIDISIRDDNPNGRKLIAVFEIDGTNVRAIGEAESHLIATDFLPNQWYTLVMRADHDAGDHGQYKAYIDTELGRQWPTTLNMIDPLCDKASQIKIHHASASPPIERSLWLQSLHVSNGWSMSFEVPQDTRVMAVDRWGRTLASERESGGVAVIDPGYGVSPYMTIMVFDSEGNLEFNSPTHWFYLGDAYVYEAQVLSADITRTHSAYGANTGIFVDSGYDLEEDWINPWPLRQEYKISLEAWCEDDSDPPGGVGDPYYRVSQAISGRHRLFFTRDTEDPPWTLAWGEFHIQYVHLTSEASQVGLRVRTFGSEEWKGVYYGEQGFPQEENPDETSWTLMADGFPEVGRWSLLIAACPVLSTCGQNIDGVSYDMFAGSGFWDVTGKGDRHTGSLRVEGENPGDLPGTYTVSWLDGDRAHVADSTFDGIHHVLNLYNLPTEERIAVFPIEGYFVVRDESGNLEYESPLLRNVWGGDIYEYSKTDFFANEIDENIRNRLVGTFTWQDDGPEPVEQREYMEYDVDGNLVTTKRAHVKDETLYWIETRAEYDDYGSMTKSWDEMNRLTEYTYTACDFAYPSEVRMNHDGQVVLSRTKWDCKFGRIESQTTPENTDLYFPENDNPTTFQYDGAGRITRIYYPKVDGQSHFVRYEYDDTLNSVTIWDENQEPVQTNYYDGFGFLKTTHRLNSDSSIYSKEKFDHDGFGRVILYQDLDDNSHSVDYDTLGRPVKFENDDLTTRLVEYFDIDNQVKYLDEERNKQLLEYDSVGRLIKVYEWPDPGLPPIATEYTYDISGNLIEVEDARGSKTSHSYDDIGRLSQTTYPDLLTERYTYYDDGSIMTKERRDLSEVSYFYDDLGRLDYVTVDDVVALEYEHDLNNNLKTLTRQYTSAAYALSYTYDERDRIEKETVAIPGSSYDVRYALDPTGFLLALTYPDDFHVSYTPDPLDRISLVTWTDGVEQDSMSISYGDKGNPSTTLQHGDLLIRHAFDERNRMTSVSASAEGSQTSVAAHVIRPDGDYVTSWNECPSSEGYNYEKVDDVAPDYDDTFVWQNLAERPDEYTMSDLPEQSPGEEVATIEVVLMARITTSNQNDNPRFWFLVNSNTYPDEAREIRSTRWTHYSMRFNENPDTGSRWTWSDIQDLRVGMRTATTANGDIRVTQVHVNVYTTVDATVDMELGYKYYKNGKIWEVTDEVRGVSEVYDYDGVGRLTSVSERWDIGYTYDEVGNRNQMVDDSEFTHYSYNPPPSKYQLDHYSHSGTTVYFDYDDNGNVIERSQPGQMWEFGYDALGSLETVHNNDVLVGTYHYDGTGRRILKSSGGTLDMLTVYLLEVPLYEENLVTGAKRHHIYLDGIRIATVGDDGTYFPVQDNLGSTRYVASWTGSTHIKTYEAAYKPFGVEIPLYGDNPESYLGKEALSEAGLYWLGARYFDPEIGRFYSLDPVLGSLLAPQTLNGYTYASNDPVGASDPGGGFACLGLCVALIVLAIVGASAAAVSVVVPEARPYLDVLMIAIGFIPLFGDVISTSYFLTQGALDCAAGSCDPLGMGFDALGILPVAGDAFKLAKGARAADLMPLVGRFIGNADGAADAARVATVVRRNENIFTLSDEVFEAVYASGRYGRTPKGLARGRFAHEVIQGTLDGGYELRRSIGKSARGGGLFPDAWKHGEIIEIKPLWKNGHIKPSWSRQVNRYLEAHLDMFGSDAKMTWYFYEFV